MRFETTDNFSFLLVISWLVVFMGLKWFKSDDDDEELDEEEDEDDEEDEETESYLIFEDSTLAELGINWL